MWQEEAVGDVEGEVGVREEFVGADGEGEEERAGAVRKARPLSEQTFYSKLPRDPYYDADWIKSLCDLFRIKA